MGDVLKHDLATTLLFKGVIRVTLELRHLQCPTKDFKFVTRGDNRKLCVVDDKIIKLIIYELVAYNCKCVNIRFTSLNSVMSDVPGITTSINTRVLLPIYLSNTLYGQSLLF